MRKGTLRQMLECSKLPDGKALNALQFPMGEEALARSPFSTEIEAWQATKGRPDCDGEDSMPAPHLRWGLCATKGASHLWHIDSNGFGTFIDVKTGQKLWIMAHPKEGRTFADITLFLGDDYQLEEPNEGLWDLEAILLEPGTRM